MQRRKSSGFANGSVHGMARALRDLRGGLGGFDTDLSGLATTKKSRLPCYEGAAAEENALAATVHQPLKNASISEAFSERNGFSAVGRECRHGPRRPKLEDHSQEKSQSGSRRRCHRRPRSFQFVAGAGHSPGLFGFDGAVAWASSQILSRRPFRPVSDWPAVVVATEV